MFRIHSFDDFCLWMYVLVDDWWQDAEKEVRRPGPAPQTCSDSELLTMILVGECAGWEYETELWSRWHERADLFPRLPSLSRLNRRRRQLEQVLARFHQTLLQRLPWAQEEMLLLDSVPVSVVAPAHAAHASSDWRVHQASYGYVSTKRMRFFGYRLHLLSTASGVILDWDLVSARTGDVAAAQDFLLHTPLLSPRTCILADKGYLSAPLQQLVLQRRDCYLLTLPKRGMYAARTFPLAIRRAFASVRQRIETLNSQLALQFGIERTTAHSFEGLVTRLRSKVTAHLCSVFCNWRCGVPLDHALHIKAFVFPFSN